MEIYPFSDIKLHFTIDRILKNGNIRKDVISNVYGFVIKRLDTIFEDEYLYVEVWKNFIDKFKKDENYHKKFSIYFSCRSSVDDNSLIDVIYELKKYDRCDMELIETFIDNKESRRLLNVTDLRTYLTKNYSRKDFESYEKYKKLFESLPSYYTSKLLKNTHHIYYMDDKPYSE